MTALERPNLIRAAAAIGAAIAAELLGAPMPALNNMGLQLATLVGCALAGGAVGWRLGSRP